VYVTSDNGNLYQLNATNISLSIANYTLGGSYVYSSPAVANGYVYVSSGDNRTFYQLNATNVSQKIASYITDDLIDFSYPAVANGYVYIANDGSRVYQLNASNISIQVANFTTDNGDGFATSPAISNNYVYIASYGTAGILYQLNASNVSQKIATYTFLNNEVFSSPAVANGYVYIGSDDANLYQLNASNIAQKIASYTTNSGISSSPAVANGYVYIADYGGHIYQLNASNVSLSVNAIPARIPVNYTCSSCAGCNINISNMSAGDMISLSQNISDTGAGLGGGLGCVNISNMTGVIFNCNGYSIIGTGSYGLVSTALLLVSNSQNTFIKNCYITLGERGLYVLNSNGTSVDNSSFIQNGQIYAPTTGLHSENSNNLRITNCYSANENLIGGEGFYFSNGKNITLINITAINNSAASTFTSIIYSNFFNVSISEGVSFNFVQNFPLNFYNNFTNVNISGFTSTMFNFNHFSNSTISPVSPSDGIFNSNNIICNSFINNVFRSDESWSCSSWSACILPCSSCSSGTGVQTRNCTDLNSCGTIITEPPLTQTCSISSAGGELPSSPENSGGSDVLTDQTISEITPSQPMQISFGGGDGGVTGVIINTAKTLTNSSLQVIKTNITSQGYLVSGLPLSQTYESFKVNTSISDSDIKNITFNFKISKAWMSALGWVVQDVNFYRGGHTSGVWDALLVNFIGQDTNYYYFSALSPGFSTFVIFMGKYECSPGDKRCFNNEAQFCLGNSTWLVTDNCQNGCKDAKCQPASIQSLFLYSGVIAAVSIAITVTFYVIFKNFRKKKK
jgi:PGF-pre-PGF domain-containing protein